ncbi:MAG: hypothetical protein V7746_09685 [Halioglobus sp.]
MNKLLGMILFLTLAGVSVNGFSDDDDSDKDLVCHKNNKTLLLGTSSLTAHLKHGDTEGSCEDADYSQPDAAVVMMHCEAVEGTLKVTAFSSSVAFATPLAEVGDGSDCAAALAELLNSGFSLESVTGTTDYLLVGQAG